MQLLPTIQGQCFLAGEEWQVFRTFNECRYTIAFDAGCQRFIAEVPLFALARLCQQWRGAFQAECARESCRCCVERYMSSQPIAKEDGLALDPATLLVRRDRV